MGARIRHAGRRHRHHQHPQRGRGPRRADRGRACAHVDPRSRVLVPARGGRDVGRRAQRHGRVPRAARARGPGARDGVRGPVAEGNVGGGTGMICHEFKGGIGTASRRRSPKRTAAGRWAPWSRPTTATASSAHRRRAGRPRRSRPARCPARGTRSQPAGRRIVARRPGGGSIIVILATDAPLLPHQCERLAQRAGARPGADGRYGEPRLGRHLPGLRDRQPRSLGRHGRAGDPRHGRGADGRGCGDLPALPAAMEAVEEAVVNALVAAETMTGATGSRPTPCPTTG